MLKKIEPTLDASAENKLVWTKPCHEEEKNEVLDEISEEIQSYIETEIIPRYDTFDAGHRRDHVLGVISSSLFLARSYALNVSMVYTIAAYHDVGLVNGREHHHTDSARLMRADEKLRQWFSEEEIAIMCDAVEDHRASSGHPPRTLYGCVVADADHDNTPEMVVRRTIQYGLKNCGEMTYEEQRARCYAHFAEKYDEGGYLHFWLPESEQSPNLRNLRALLHDAPRLQNVFDRIYKEELARIG